ncbi:MAG: T9SS type A sorting domain-containing protein [Bacteroidales bacterium]
MKQILVSIFVYSLMFTAFGQETNQKNHHSAAWKKFKTQKTTENRLYYRPKMGASTIYNLKSAYTVMQKMDSLVVVDSYDGQTENSFKESFTYNDLGMITSFTESEWDFEQSKWIESYQSVLQYNADLNLSEDISYNWDLTNNQWVATSKEVYSYNENLKPSLATGYLWRPDSESWMLDYQDEYTYTTNAITLTRFIWDEQSQNWIIGYKTEYQYDTESKLLLETSFAWNPVVSIWENLNKNEFAYNSNGKLETQISSYWYNEFQSWDFGQKEQYSYNAEDDMTVHNSYEWDISLEHWTPMYKEENTYNNQFTYNELIVPDLFENNEVYFNHMLTSLSGFEYYEGVWEYLGVISFYYSEIDITGIRDNQDDESIIFPNPASNRICFSWNENTPGLQIEIYNAAGMLVLNQWVDNHSTISISWLPKGFYLFKLSDKQAIRHVEKFIVQ